VALEVTLHLRRSTNWLFYITLRYVTSVAIFIYQRTPPAQCPAQ